MNVNIVPDYSFILPFEVNFNRKQYQDWMIENWTLSLYSVALYLTSIFGGQYYLRSRKPFKLRGYLTAWNTTLAIFSLIGALRSVPELWHTVRHHGLYHSVCSNSNVDICKVSGFWGMLFVFSKLPELGDTVFMVLRKQPLNFLHWYHHSTVLIYAFYSYSEGNATSRWFTCMNYSVHALMYTYYAFRAAGFQVPRFCAMVVTSLQLLQMIVGVFINIQTYKYKYHGTNASAACQTSLINIVVALTMYFSYFLLFARLFYKSYFASGDHKSQTKLKKAN